MKTSKVIDMLKKGNFVVPLYLFQLRDKFKIELEEFIFLVYLTSLGDKILFDVSKFSNDLNISIPNVMSYIDDLASKKYITIDLIKNDKNLMEEYISLDLFYEKLTNNIVENINNVDDKDENTNIYEAIEKEFARPLTPVEYEIVHAWLESGTSEEIILEALKEAVLNGVSTLRYIDKIIFEWNKKGIKTREDVENNRKNFKKKQEEKEKLDLFDYDDWYEEKDE